MSSEFIDGGVAREKYKERYINCRENAVDDDDGAIIERTPAAHLYVTRGVEKLSLEIID